MSQRTRVKEASACYAQIVFGSSVAVLVASES